jgi:hypothetical protein
MHAKPITLDPGFFDRRESRSTLVRYATDHNISLIRAREHFFAVAQYVVIAATAAEFVSPSAALDRTWHAFICSTKQYRQFCRDVLGRFLDHEPYLPGAEQPEQYQRALELARERFGADALDPALWTTPVTPSSVGNCQADGDCG